MRPFFKPLETHDTLNVAYLLSRISEKIETKEECWIWTAALTKDGYGNMGMGPKTERLHRIIYRICIGDIPPHREVCHTCDVPACCNPLHLFVGTHDDNMKDCARKGRIKSRDSRGSKNPQAKLTEEITRQIREKYRKMPIKGRAMILSEEYGVSRATIYRIANGEIWA